MEEWVCFDGSFMPESKAFLPLSDRAFLFGDGIFTSVKVICGRALFFDRHVERMKSQAFALNIDSSSFTQVQVEKLIALNKAEMGVWRLKLIVTGGSLAGLELSKRKGRSLMTLTPYSEDGRCEWTLLTASGCSLGMLSSIKSLSYLERLWMRTLAKDKGFDDALAITPEGFILEASCANIFWIHEGMLYFPDPSLQLLSGITLDVIKERAAVFKPVPVKAMLPAIPKKAAVYLCNSLMGVRAVTRIQDFIFQRDVKIETYLRECLE